MKTKKTKVLLVGLAALFAAWLAIPATAEAGGPCYSHRCGSCGVPVYKQMICVGYDYCGRPIYQWVVCSHSCRPCYRPPYSYPSHYPHYHHHHYPYHSYSPSGSFHFGFSINRGYYGGCR